MPMLLIRNWASLIAVSEDWSLERGMEGKERDELLYDLFLGLSDLLFIGNLE